MSETIESSEKKFLGLDGLNKLVENIKTGFSPIDHTHEVDSILSDTSENPVQNKAIKAEFQAVSDRIDEVASIQPDWNVSDETSAACILNKPFGDAPDILVYEDEYGLGVGDEEVIYESDSSTLYNPKGATLRFTFSDGTSQVVDGECEYPWSSSTYNDGDLSVTINPNDTTTIDSVPNGLRIVKIEEIGEIKTLDPKYLPDTVAMLEYTDATYALKSDFQSLETSLTDGNVTVAEAAHAAAADTADNATSAESATKATQDASGNIITETYALKTELASITNTRIAEICGADIASIEGVEF